MYCARLANLSKQGALGALATGIAHEVNQPLVAIKNYARAAKRYAGGESPDGSKLVELIAEMGAETNRAGVIIQKIRALLRTGQVHAERCSLSTVVRDVLRELTAKMPADRTRVSMKIEVDVPPVLADPLQLQLVVANLLRNALESVEFAPAGDAKRVTISARATDDGEVELSVADTGAGAPVDAIEELFAPLFSTKASGMGMGLAVSRTIVEAHGGRIWCVPNPSGGATFLFTLPVAGGA